MHKDMSCFLRNWSIWDEFMIKTIIVSELRKSQLNLKRKQVCFSDLNGRYFAFLVNVSWFTVRMFSSHYWKTSACSCLLIWKQREHFICVVNESLRPFFKSPITCAMCLILDYIGHIKITLKARARQITPVYLFNPANEKSTGAVPWASSGAMVRRDSAESTNTNDLLQPIAGDAFT